MLNIKYGDASNPRYYPEENTIDLCITDPPFKPKYKKYEQIRQSKTKNKLDAIPTPDTNEYNIWWLNVVKNIFNSLKKGGYFIFKSDDYTAREVYETTKTFFDYRGSIIWDKKMIGLGWTIRKQHELLEIYVKKGATPYFDKRVTPKTKIKMKTLDGGETIYEPKKWHGDYRRANCLSSVITMLPVRIGVLGHKVKHEHINQTPVELWNSIIPFFIPQGGKILDPFAGTGSIRKSVEYLNKYRHLNINIEDFDINGVSE